MSQSPELEHLAAQWAEHPDGFGFAALADGLRKRGSAAEALSVAHAGVGRQPGFLPGHLVLARIHVDQGDLVAAAATLRAALGIDPAHPMVLEALAGVADAAGDPAAARAWREALDASYAEALAPPTGARGELTGVGFDGSCDVADHELDQPAELLLTESLAALYQRQGHLDRAHEVFAALAARDPGNATLAARRDSVGAQLALRRPLPYDAAVSGGAALGNWLAALAAATSEPVPQPRAGYDAFFQPQAPSADETADFEAFQVWLQRLPR